MKLFLVTDMQEDIAEKLSGADALDKRIAERIHACRYDGTDVIFTVDSRYGNKLYGNTAKQRMMCDMTFVCDSYPSLDLAEYLKQKEYSAVEICGLASGGAVLGNALMAKAALPGAEIIIDEHLTDDPDSKLLEKTLDVMEGFQINVIRK